MDKNKRIEQLEEEVRILQAQLELVGNEFPDGKEMKRLRSTLNTFNMMPNATVYTTVRDLRTRKLKFDYVGTTWERIMGVSEEATLADAQNILNNVHPDDLPGMLQKIDESISMATNFEIEVRYIHPALKKEIWIEIFAYPQRVGDYNIANGFIYNVTDRKNTEIELRKEKMRLQALANNLPDVVLYQFVLNTQTGQKYFSYVSNGWEALTSVPAEIALSSPEAVFSKVHPDDLPVLLQKIETCFLKMEDMYLEFRLIVNGSTRWVLQSGSPHLENELIVADTIVLDITERKNAELALAESERKLKLILDNAKEALWIADYKTSKYTFLAGAYLEMLGYTFKEFTQTEMYDILTPQSKKERMNAIEKIAKKYYETGIIENITHESQLRRKDGTLIWFEASIQLVADENGNLSQIIGVSRNIEDRKRAEQALVESERKQRFIFENTKDVFMILDIATLKFIFVGGAGFEMYGWTNEELLHVELDDYFDKETLDKLRSLITQKINEYRETGIVQHIQIEEQQFRKDGSRIWVESTLQLVPDENGEIHQIVIIDRNIDERKKTEKALAESERKHKLISDNAKETFWMADFRTLKYSYAAGAYYNMWGYTHEEMLQKHIYDILAPEMQDVVSALHREMFEKFTKIGTIDDIDIDVQAQHKDGNVFWINVSVQLVKDENGEPQVIGVSRNIEDRKKTEKALAESERKQRFIFENTKEVFLILDITTSKFIFVGGASFEMFGWTNEELAQQPPFVRFEPDTATKYTNLIDEKIKEYYETGIIQYFQFEALQIRKDGSKIWVETSVQLVADKNGKITQVVGIDRNIDERKRMEIELAAYHEHLEELVEERTNELVESIRAKEKAEEADRLKSTFLANISHEIRTPLNGIVGLLRFIESRNLSSEQRQEVVNIMNNSSSHLVNLVDDIIDFSKIEAQQLTMYPVPANLNELMNELRKFFETYLISLNKENIRIMLDESNFIENCTAYIDEKRLRQVLNNLIGNAVKFTDKGHIRFGYRQSAPDRLEFVIEDTGIGLPEHQKEIIFERFRQSDIGNSSKYGGTGLGLTISQSLVQMMGGEMWVKSTEGEGSSFYFTILYKPVSK